MEIVTSTITALASLVAGAIDSANGLIRESEANKDAKQFDQASAFRRDLFGVEGAITALQAKYPRLIPSAKTSTPAEPKARRQRKIAEASPASPTSSRRQSTSPRSKRATGVRGKKAALDESKDFNAVSAYRPYILQALYFLNGMAEFRDVQELAKHLMKKGGIFKAGDDYKTDGTTRPRWLAMTSSLRQTLLRNQIIVSNTNGVDQLSEKGHNALFDWAKGANVDLDAKFKMFHEETESSDVVEIRKRYADKSHPIPRPSTERRRGKSTKEKETAKA